MAKQETIILNGTAYWAHVVTPEEYNGTPIGYSIIVDFEDDEKLARFQDYMEKFYEANKEDTWKTDPKMTPNLPLKETKVGDGETRECAKAKCVHEYQDKKTGEIIAREVPVFDEYGEPLPKGTYIGNGSKVQVNVTPRVYMTNKKNFGVSLRLNAICVTDLVAYGSKNADSYGFATKDKVEEDELQDGEMEF
ncbi:hypothetical protein [Veillonella intestinalis]|uniref:ssDNA-binding protein n=1 Tax=Veillonella intestinalis TaxID=2941341 RepID=UPI00203DDC96|nr:hypothetical protein [Veillonella intestinalis]